MSTQAVQGASFSQRTAAFILDGLITAALAYAVILAAAIASNVLGDRGPSWIDELWVIPAIVVTVGYVAAGYARRQTIGMKSAGVRIQRTATGARLTWPRAIVRAVETVLFIASPLVLVVYGFSDPPTDGYTAADRVLIAAGAATFALTLLGNLWMLLDPAHRTLQDRIAGVEVVPAERSAQPARPPSSAAPA